MQQLRKQATAASGVDYSAVTAAKEANLYSRLGEETFYQLSNSFYTLVYSDEGWFRTLFANTTKEAAMQNQREFLIQEFGGPPLYKQRKGYTAILGRHGPYPVSEEGAKQWLTYMEQAIKNTTAIGNEDGELMMGYFRHMAYYIVFGQELVNGERTVGYYGKHKEGEI